MTKFSAILATGRISNLPTVWCNVLVAFLLVQLSLVVFADFPSSTFSAPLLLVTCLAASCLYVGGCFLGDAVDVEFDKSHKPDRPIPMGVLDRNSIYGYAAFLMATGIVLPFSYLKFSTGTFAPSALIASLLLAGAIIIYSLWHKRSPWIGLPFIGACRFFLVLFGAYIAITTAPSLKEVFNASAEAVRDGSITGVCRDEGVRPIIFLYPLCVGLYTICFASVARSESSPKPITWRKGLMVTMLLLPLLALPLNLNILFHTGVYIPSLTALVLYWLWMVSAFRKINTNKGQFVSRSLAGFCLLDATFAAQFGWPWLVVCLALFGLSHTLQKWAPAT
jgi:4-hydroxybenzoate polyprenyltransferase